MSSAAAVAANAALSPTQNSIGEDGGQPSPVTSLSGSMDEVDLKNGDLDVDHSEDDIKGTARRRGLTGEATMDGQEDEEDKDELEGLFGDESEEPKKRQLDDQELDSGDDMDRADRAVEGLQTDDEETETQERLVMDLEIARQPLPEPSDGEMYLLRIPDFLSIEPTSWDHGKFQPPTADAHSNKQSSIGFSAYNTALSSIRWRHSPSNNSQVQSNARILRWSDGSMTLQLASQPTVQYEIDGNPLAPPQRNPIKPTPVSVQDSSTKGGRQGDGTVLGEKYDPSKDAFTYLAVPSLSNGTLRISHKLTAGLSIKQSDNVTDDAIERLQAALAIAANATKVHGASGAELQLIDEDPEKKRQEAESAMKEKMRAEKRRETAAMREQERSNRALGRHGLSSGRYGGGLNTGFLEDDEMGIAHGGTGRHRKIGATPRKPRQRRNSIYSDDEDFGRRKFTSREDEYDEEDDFVAPSDEEEIVEDGDDEDEDDGIHEDFRARETPKRERPAPAEDDERDAEGEVDEEALPAAAARKRQRVIVDEDEEE